jgi:hypothetical protein
MALHRIEKTPDEIFLDECVRQLEKYFIVRLVLVVVSLLAAAFTLSYAVGSNPNVMVIAVGYALAVVTVMTSFMVAVYERHLTCALVDRVTAMAAEMRRDRDILQRRYEGAPHVN